MRVMAAVLTTLLISSSPVMARDMRPAEERDHSFSADLASCEDGAVLGHIANYFATKESHFWGSSVRIQHFENVRKVADRPWGLDTIPRRFCTATALLSDGQYHEVDYSIRSGLGFVGLGTSSVDWCVRGYDRSHTYSPSCKLAQP
ncbi:hypothetical protein WJT86_09255 [Microvirga sp. W0021]|uniref:Uncharacterized protein n=1 Tax=Hohaiivirga grylli TaxID=3133970 RepID=A0ABV0BJR8_9HYPH